MGLTGLVASGTELTVTDMGFGLPQGLQGMRVDAFILQ
jgi:hypothetical protein